MRERGRNTPEMFEMLLRQPEMSGPGRVDATSMMNCRPIEDVKSFELDGRAS